MLKEFKGKTALITGAGSGFGAEFAKEAASRGMKLLLNDLCQDKLDAIVKTVKDMGVEAVGVQGDVSLYEEYKKVVKAAVDNFGTIDLLMNNAGVYFVGAASEVPVRDVQWMLETNVMPIFYGAKEVIPIMKAQGTPCHILNVASLAGFVAMSSMSAYHASKHAVAAASEAMLLDLAREAPDIGISIYCPGYVQTNLHHTPENRPERFKENDDPYYKSESYAKNKSRVDKFITTGVPIDTVAKNVFKGIEEGQFFIRTESDADAFIAKRHSNILSCTNPDPKNLM